MLKPIRVFFGIGIFLLVLAAIPLSITAEIKSSSYSTLKNPIAWFRTPAKIVGELLSFQKNARENQQLKNALGQRRYRDLQFQELKLENNRLTRLLGLKSAIPAQIRHSIFSRVILRSSLGWNRIILIDKGTRQGIKPNRLVLSESSVIGKVVLCGPAISQVLLISDPKSRLGAVIQRTRQEGLLFGTSFGDCHMKYISIDTEVKSGDTVVTAGFGGFFPKGLPIGTVERVWKEPGQIYQVAQIRPLMDLNQIEEVAVID
ncbi:MAG: rod shape-determining protein MreC [Candidatus Omnitrophica bacterium CG1_02_46_14]|nr:MAG: rod shape-determining protein MreC [Candidatus Omnitrophica bacterium CG1_02_46_14]